MYTFQAEASSRIIKSHDLNVYDSGAIMHKSKQTILQSYTIIVRDLKDLASSKVMYNPQPTAQMSYFTIVHDLTCNGS